MAESIKRVLVTGGTGVTGVALVRYLLAKDIAVTAIVRPGSFREKYLPCDDKRLSIVYCALNDLNGAAEKVRDFGRYDAFFHLAWEGSTIADKQGSRDNMQLQSRNIVYAVDAVELCRSIDCPVFLMTGSQAEYGDSDSAISEETVPNPINGYGNAKLCAENMSRIMCRSYGIRHVIARLFSIYGPYDGTNSMINTCVLKLLKGERPEYTAGEQQWNYLYSFDAAKALLLLAEKGQDGEFYNVADPQGRQLKDYIGIMHKVVAPDIPVILGEMPYPGGIIKNMIADTSKLVKTIGFTPDHSFAEGIQEIMRWCKDTGEEYLGSVENGLCKV